MNNSILLTCRQTPGPRVEAVESPEKPAISTNFRYNHQIRISPIRLIDEQENQIGVITTSDALKMAQERGLDLVEVAPTARPPVCRIMDYGKWRYQQRKKEDKSRAASRGGQLKELKLRTVKIGDHDLMIKVSHAREFLKEGNKVQFTLQFRGREMAHQELGRDLMIKVKTELWPVSKVERDAKMEGRRMTLVLQPDHKAPGAKMPVPVKIAPPIPGALRPAGHSGAGAGLNVPVRANPVANLPVGPRGSGPIVRPNPVANLPVAPAGAGVQLEPAAPPAEPDTSKA